MSAFSQEAQEVVEPSKEEVNSECKSQKFSFCFAANWTCINATIAQGTEDKKDKEIVNCLDGFRDCIVESWKKCDTPAEVEKKE